MEGNIFVLILVLVQHVTLFCLRCPLAQLFPAAWAGSMGQHSAYLSFLFCKFLANDYQFYHAKVSM
jgi:hypothetical protein